MTTRTLKLSNQEKQIQRSAKIRGWVELIFGGIGVLWIIGIVARWSYLISDTSYLPWTLIEFCFILLMLTCGILSIYRPFSFIRLNLVLGGLLIADGIAQSIRSLVSGKPSTAIGIFIIGALVGFVILYHTTKISRGLSEQTRTASDLEPQRQSTVVTPSKSIPCPYCGAPVPITKPKCPACGRMMMGL